MMVQWLALSPVCIVCPCLPGFSSGTLASSRSPKTCMLIGDEVATCPGCTTPLTQCQLELALAPCSHDK